MDFKTTAYVPSINIASLYAAMMKGLIYVNVHMVKNPNGEVRYQVTLKAHTRLYMYTVRHDELLSNT